MFLPRRPRHHLPDVAQDVIQRRNNRGVPFFTELPEVSLIRFPGPRRGWYTKAAVSARLEIERLADESHGMPLLVIQGEADRRMPIEFRDENIGR